MQSIYWLSGAFGGYTQDWLKSDETIEGAHPHEGLRLAGGDGWVAVGGTLMPCPSMWPKQFWSVQNGFGLTKLIWTWPYWFGLDQNEMVTTKMN